MSTQALYPATFTQSEVINKTDKDGYVTLLPGQYVPIGEYVVLADELVGIGRGQFGTQNEAIGRLYALFKDTDDKTFEGKFRIMLLSSQEIPIGGKPVYLDVDLAALRTGATLPADRFVLPFDNVMLSKDKKIQFLINVAGDVNVAMSKDKSVVLMDMTRVIV